MIFELAQDFHDAVAAMPRGHRRQRMLELLEEAIRRDVHFVDRHPTTLFQCLWNTCWWYDSPEAEAWYELEDPTTADLSPWRQPGPRLHQLFESFRNDKGRSVPEALWARATSPPPLRLGRSEMVLLRGHHGDPLCFAFSRSNRLLVTGCVDHTRFTSTGLRDNTVRVWDIQTGRETSSYRANEYGVRAVAISPDETLVASAGEGTEDRAVRVWRSDTGQPLWKFSPTPDKGLAEYLAFTPCGNWLVCLSNGTVDLWRLADDGRNQWDRPITFKYETRWDFYTLPEEGCLDTDTWTTLTNGCLEFELILPSERVRLSVPISDTIPCVVIPGTSGRGPELRPNRPAVLLTIDARRFRSRVYKRVWQFVARFLRCRVENSPDEVRDIQINFPDGFLIGKGCAWHWRLSCRLKTATLRVFHLLTRRFMRSVSEQMQDILRNGLYSCRSPDGRYIAVLTERKSPHVIVFDATSACELARMRGVGFSHPTFSPDGLLLALAWENDGTIALWNWRRPMAECCYSLRQTDHPGFDQPMARGKYAAAAKFDEINITHNVTGEVICRAGVRLRIQRPGLEQPSYRVMALTLSRDGTKLAYAQCDRGICIWDFRQLSPESLAERCRRSVGVELGGLRMEDDGLGYLPDALSFSSDDRVLAGGNSDNRSSVLWDATTGKCLLVLRTYIQPRVLADGSKLFPYLARLTLTETILETGDTHQVLGWLPETTPSLANPSGKPEWAFRRQMFRLERMRGGSAR
jgi:WD40 repeat protein